MKREEKNQQTRRRIMDSALAEFAANGYGDSSVNTICAAQGISKGIVYHYFESKDELYLACVEECFQCLTAHLSAALPEEDAGAVEDQLGRYFSARMAFFQEHPIYQSIFCEAVISPPAPLAEGVRARRKEFDALTVSTLERLLRRAAPAGRHYRGGRGGPVQPVPGFHQRPEPVALHPPGGAVCPPGRPVPQAADRAAVRRDREG